MLLKLSGIAFASCLSLTASAHSGMFPDTFRFDNSNEGRSVSIKDRFQQRAARGSSTAQNCVDGLAGDYPCRNIDLLSLLAPSEMGGGDSLLNDIWGWEDLVNGREYAIVGRINGTSFVDVTDPTTPIWIGFLPAHDGGADAWRDVKVYQDHAFIVADGFGNATHGLQVFDLRTLATTTPGSTLSETAHLGGFGPAHNIAINEDTGFAYVVGAYSDSNTGLPVCGGGLYMVDISSPQSPGFSGCFSSDGYTHDVQCVVYAGPDSRYTGNEICFAYNEDTLTVVDVSNKNNPVQVSRTPYPGANYTHQGWLLDDNQNYLVLNDETDEINTGANTTSHVFDISVLTSPDHIGSFTAETAAIDHNLYTKDSYVFESNYRAGLRILSSDNIASGTLEERGYFDTVPCSDSAQFSGAWSNYPYLASGNILISDIESGLFVLRANSAALAANDNDAEPAISPVCDGAGVGGGSSGGGGGSSTIHIGVLILLASLGIFSLFVLRRR